MAKDSQSNETQAPGGARSYAPVGSVIEAPAAAGGLYLVATPIGNLGDISLRALELLAAADVIACEDTRVTRKLTERYGIATPLMAYHEHNAEEARPKIIARLEEGHVVALVSDAGTPLISDPGYKLVRATIEAGHAVTALPGASAVMSALNVAGLPTDRFFFRRLSAAEAGWPPEAHCRTRNHPRNIGAVRKRPASGSGARRPRRGSGRTSGFRLPRTHQAARGSPARRSCGACWSLCGRCRDARRDRHRHRAA